jgi:hypothetical protein
MANYPVELVLNLGVSGEEYTFPLVQGISDPSPAMKANVIEGNRASGSIIIPGGQKSIEIKVRGILLDNDGYADLQTKINTMKSMVTTDVSTLTLRYYDSTWKNTWAYTVRRIDEIEFEEDNLRTNAIEYNIRFIVLSY